MARKNDFDDVDVDDLHDFHDNVDDDDFENDDFDTDDDDCWWRVELDTGWANSDYHTYYHLTAVI